MRKKKKKLTCIVVPARQLAKTNNVCANERMNGRKTERENGEGKRRENGRTTRLRRQTKREGEGERERERKKERACVCVRERPSFDQFPNRRRERCEENCVCVNAVLLNDPKRHTIGELTADLSQNQRKEWEREKEKERKRGNSLHPHVYISPNIRTSSTPSNPSDLSIHSHKSTISHNFTLKSSTQITHADPLSHPSTPEHLKEVKGREDFVEQQGGYGRQWDFDFVLSEGAENGVCVFFTHAFRVLLVYLCVSEQVLL